MGKIRLILADKEAVFREGLAKLLENEPDIEVVSVCSTGLEAVESTYKYRPDVILIDKELFIYNSVEAMQRILKRLPKTNIIVFTYSETEIDFFYAVRLGVKAYLSKDVSIQTLIKSITLVAEGGIVISSPMATSLLAEFKSLEEGKDAQKSITILSKREQEVLSLVARGFINRDIATTLFISENTVKVHLRNIMEKLHVHTRQQAVNLGK